MTSRVLGVALATALVSVACFSDKQKPNTPPVPVAVTRATQRDVPYNLTADGVVEPMQTAQVQAQVGGILTKVAFREGDEVAAGQVLFELDPRPFKALLDQAEANLARDQANYVNAKAEADRYLSLVQKDYVTKEQSDQEVANAGAASAAVKADTAAVEQARINLEWATIRAPIAGRAGQLLVRAGNLVRAGTQQPLVLINQIQPILVHFALPATSLPAIMQYSAKDTAALPVTVVPGMPPNTTAQPTSTGPTPAYTTDPTTDDQQTETVGVGTGDDPVAAGGQAGGARGGRARSAAGGPPSGPPTGTSPAAGQVAAGGGDPPLAPGAAPAGGAGRRRAGGAAAGDSSARPPGGATAQRQPATMPGLPGVPAPSPSKGTLSLIDNQVDTTTGTVLLKAKFLNTSRMLWPGQFVATTLRLFVEKNALVVPAQAVMTGQQGTYVYLVDQTGVARLRTVTVERTAGNAAVIGAGLVVGDQVVTDGQSRLSPGSKVNIRGVVPAGSGGTPPAPSSSPG